ncbi:MAG: lipid-A-disaccharide synthase [Acidobacteria bacterium]|nr:lipid-A-disaccharide synthase [Acidobacteriota bacterium]
MSGGPGRRRVLIVAGETSGDRHAAGLMRQAAAIDPGLEFVGIGGAEMRAAGLDPIFDAESIAVVGLFEVLRHLPALRRAFALCLETLRGGVDAVVLVDYPGFNLRLAARAHAMGARVLYFISPQVWAWKAGRIDQIARDIDRLLVVFPFEVDLYRGRGLEVECVGHPLVDEVRASGPPDDVALRIGLDPRRPTLGILPGSRASEVSRHLPPALGAARRLKRFERELQIVIPLAPTIDDATTRSALAEFPDLNPVLSREPFYDLLSVCRAAIVSSGTATLEAALMEIPMVVIYRLHPLTAMVARRLTTIENFGLVNVVAGARIVPECIQENCTPERIAREVERFFADPALREGVRRDLAGIRAKLGEGGAYTRAARSLVDFLSKAGDGARAPAAL